MKKRLLGALLCVSMIAAMLAGCGSKEKSADTKSKTSDANELVMGVSSSDKSEQASGDDERGLAYAWRSL